MRVVIRARGRGPLGFVRLPLPADGPSGSLTYAAVRKAITEQLAEVMPDEAYVFLLEGGVPVAPSQESAERPAEGMSDCFISFFPKDASAASPLQPVVPGGLGAAADFPPYSQQLLMSAPSRSMVKQWIDSFAFMEPREQQEAISYLQLRPRTSTRGSAAPGTGSRSVRPLGTRCR